MQRFFIGNPLRFDLNGLRQEFCQIVRRQFGAAGTDAADLFFSGNMGDAAFGRGVFTGFALERVCHLRVFRFANFHVRQRFFFFDLRFDFAEHGFAVAFGFAILHGGQREVAVGIVLQQGDLLCAQVFRVQAAF